MNRSANVIEIEAIHRLEGALVRFQGEAREALDMLSLEVRRAVDWIENDRRRYWQDQLRRASRRLVDARSELERCQLKFGSEEAPSCYEQRMAVERAWRRLRLCEDKVRITQRWTRDIRRAVEEFDGQRVRMGNSLDADVPRALARLERMLVSLEKYTGTAAVAGSSRAGDEEPDESARGGQDESGGESGCGSKLPGRDGWPAVDEELRG